MKAYFVYSAVVCLLWVCLHNAAWSQKVSIEKGMHYLRPGQHPEWNEFENLLPKKNYSATFIATKNNQEYSLHLRQYDVKQAWQVILNGRTIGHLTVDENDLNIYFPIPAALLLNGSNKLSIEPAEPVTDDIMVGEIWLETKSVQAVLSECSLWVEVRDADSGVPIPSRITIVDSNGTLQTVGASSNDSLAARPGFIYTSTGKAAFTFPEGTYKLYATRGFEYGVDSVRLVVKAGGKIQKKISIRREVSTQGWISCDTHLHTLTYSGHGDATIKERLLTIAGEGVELPVITEHNVIIDVRTIADSLGLLQYFTPVAGNELTTTVGHFNLFPLSSTSLFPDPSIKSWSHLSRDLERFDLPIVILNHARDIHNNFRPFDPKQHIAIAGMRLDQQDFPATAMEIINSGSQQTDRTRLLFDWFGMLNRGHFLTPVGSSDSHDVGRYLAGQSRTYIKANDADVGGIDVSEAVQNFKKGNVMVSFGLLAEIALNDTYGPGDLAPLKDNMRVHIKVSGPAWIQADKVSLYANGQKLGEKAIENRHAAGVKWEGSWELPKMKHDVFLVAVAEGAGKYLPFWPIAKPYQPASPHWESGVMGLSGAVWIDADGNGKRTSAYDYAKDVFNKCGGNLVQLIKLLAPYDEATSVQVASILHEQGLKLSGPAVAAALQQATPATKKGFAEFIDAWKLSR